MDYSTQKSKDPTFKCYNMPVELNLVYQTFKTSIGYGLIKFKFRHGIRQLNISGEKLTAHSEVVANCKEQLNLEIPELNLIKEQVCNEDEIVFN